MKTILWMTIIVILFMAIVGTAGIAGCGFEKCTTEQLSNISTLLIFICWVFIGVTGIKTGTLFYDKNKK